MTTHVVGEDDAPLPELILPVNVPEECWQDGRLVRLETGESATLHVEQGCDLVVVVLLRVPVAYLRHKYTP